MGTATKTTFRTTDNSIIRLSFLNFVATRWCGKQMPIINGVPVVCGVNASVAFRIVWVELATEKSAIFADGMNLP